MQTERTEALQARIATKRMYAERNRRLRELGYPDYAYYLKSPAWAAAKARYRASDEPQACMCGAIDDVHIHHKTYERVGAELPSDLLALCVRCHVMVHQLERRGDLAIDLANFESAQRAAGYAIDTGSAAARARQEFQGAHAEQRRKRAQAAARQIRALIKRQPDHPVLEFIEDLLAECEPS